MGVFWYVLSCGGGFLVSGWDFDLIRFFVFMYDVDLLGVFLGLECFIGGI